MWDVNGDGKITQAEMKERGGPAGTFPQIDLNADGVYDREEHNRAWKTGDFPHLMAAIPAAGQGDMAGKAAVLRAGREWEVLAINDLGEECYATPALSGNRIFMRSRGHLWCFRNTQPKK